MYSAGEFVALLKQILDNTLFIFSIILIIHMFFRPLWGEDHRKVHKILRLDDQEFRETIMKEEFLTNWSCIFEAFLQGFSGDSLNIRIDIIKQYLRYMLWSSSLRYAISVFSIIGFVSLLTGASLLHFDFYGAVDILATTLLSAIFLTSAMIFDLIIGNRKMIIRAHLLLAQRVALEQDQAPC